MSDSIDPREAAKRLLDELSKHEAIRHVCESCNGDDIVAVCRAYLDLSAPRAETRSSA